MKLTEENIYYCACERFESRFTGNKGKNKLKLKKKQSSGKKLILINQKGEADES